MQFKLIFTNSVLSSQKETAYPWQNHRLMMTNFKQLNPPWEAASTQLLRNFPTFFGTQRIITVFTRALHCSLSWASSIQSTPSHPISLKIHFNIVHPPTSLSSSSHPLTTGFVKGVLGSNVCALWSWRSFVVVIFLRFYSRLSGTWLTQ
jgi:hypothetical protein